MIRDNSLIRTRAPHARGNVFALLFGAVALTGVLAAVGMQTLTGPVTTITRVTQKNIADTQLLMDAKIIINAAVAGTNGGDIETPSGDGYIEPAVMVAAGGGETPPVNGGYLPTTLGLTLTDPWGTKYGYCVWDHGSTNSSTGRITGDPTSGAASQPVVAIIAAGPDKVFQTTCPAYTSGQINVTKTGGSDDLIFSFTYAEASANSNGLWTLNVGNNKQAELKSSSGGAPTVSINRDTGVGDFIGITTSTIAAKGAFVAMDGGLKLDNAVPDLDCDAQAVGSMRFNAGSTPKKIEFCDGAAWKAVGSDLWVTDETHVWRMNGNIGLGTATPAEKLDVVGNAAVSGNIAAGGTLGVTGNTTLGGTLGVTGAATLGSTLGVTGNTTLGGTLGVTGNSTLGGTLDVTGATALDGTLDVGGNVAVNTDKFTVDATTGNTDIAGTLGVDGNTVLGGTLGAGASTLASLDVTGNASVGGTLAVTGNTAIDTDTFYVNAATNAVGIGTASPGAKLEVAGGIKFGLQNTCDAGGANDGTMRYNPATLSMEYCIAAAWKKMSSIDLLDDVGDVEISEVGTPSDNALLAWDAGGNRWVAKTVNTVGNATIAVPGDDGSIQFKTGTSLDADKDYFVYDKSTHRLAIGGASPSETLDVTGTAAVSGDMDVGGALGVTGVAAFGNSVGVAGNLVVDTTTLAVNATSNSVGVGTASPTSMFQVASGGYAQFSKNFAGAPTAGDCDDASEVGRMTYDTTNNRWFVCTSASGWVYTSMGASGGTANAGGSDKQVQFNDNGALAGASTMVWDKTNGLLGIGTSTPGTNRVVNGTAPLTISAGNTPQFSPMIKFREEGSTNSEAVIGYSSNNVNGMYMMHYSDNMQFGFRTSMFGPFAIFTGNTVTPSLEVGYVSPWTGSASSVALNVRGQAAGYNGTAVGVQLSSPIVANANNDSLYGFYINPTYNDNSKTGVTHTDIGFDGTVERSIVVARNSVSDTAGSNLALTAGAATAGATDKNGGTLSLSGGVATGDGMSSIVFKTARPGQGAGTTDRVPAVAMTLASNALTLPSGPTAQQPGQAGMQASVEGMIRYDTDLGKYQAYQQGAWQDILTNAPGNSIKWSSLSDPNADLALTMGAYTSTFTFDDNTGANNLFNFVDTTNNTGTGYMVNIATATGSTLKPFHVSAAGTDAITVLANGYVGIGSTAPTARLTVGRTPGRYVDLAGGGGRSIMVANDNSDNTVLTLQNSRDGGYGAGMAFNLGYDGSPDNSVVGTALAGARILAKPDQTWTSTASTQDAGLLFGTIKDGAFTYGMKLSSDGFLGVGTTAPTYLLSLGGDANRTIGMERTVAGTDGLDLTVRSGGAKSGATDKNGGSLFLSSGTTTGNGMSSIQFQTVKPGQGTGSTDRAPAVSMVLSSNALTIPSGPTSEQPGQAGMQASVAGMLRYDTTVGKFQAYQSGAWQDILTSGGGGVLWSSLGDPDDDLALTMADHTSTFTYGATTGANNLFTLTDTASNTGTGYLMNLSTATGSTLKPLNISVKGRDALSVNTDGDIVVGHDGVDNGESNRILLTGLGDSAQEQVAAISLDTNSNYGHQLKMTFWGQPADVFFDGWNGGTVGAQTWYNNKGSGNPSTILWNATDTGMIMQNGYTQTSGAFLTMKNNNTELMRVMYDGKVGIGTNAPTDLLHVASTGYPRFEKAFAGAPTAGDCDAAGEVGRMTYDTTNDRWYVCTSASGWVYTTMGATGGAASPGGNDTEVQFNDGGALAGAANMVWDKTNNRLGLGTATPTGILDVQGGTAASGNGTDITLAAQNGFGTGNTNGGNILLDAGVPNGTGTKGGLLIGTVNPTAVGIGIASSTVGAPLHVFGADATTKVVAAFEGDADKAAVRIGNRQNIGVTGRYLEFMTDYDEPIIRSVGYGQNLKITSSSGILETPNTVLVNQGYPTGSNSMYTLRVGHGAGQNTNVNPVLSGSGGLGVWAHDINSSLLSIGTPNNPHNTPLLIVNQDVYTRFVVAGNGKVGIGTDAPSTIMSFGGEANNVIGMERTAAGTDGLDLTLRSGGAKSGETNKNGGSLFLSSGTATGNGMSSIQFQTVKPGQGTGTTDRAPAVSMVLSSNALTIPSGPTTEQPGQSGMQASVDGMLRYDTTINKFQAYQGGAWQDILTSAAGNGISWSSLSDPTTNLALTMGANTSTFTYGATTGSNNLFNLTDTNSNTGTGYLMNLTTGTSSTLKPFRIAAGGVEVMAVNAAGYVGFGTTTPPARLTLGGATSAPAWNMNGIAFRIGNNTYTDTTSSGTINTVINYIGQPTFASTNATTVTNASNFYIAGAPIAGTNATITNPLALHVAAGNSYFGGNVGIGTTGPAGQLNLAGNMSAPAWTTSGIGFRIDPATYTDTTSSGSINTVIHNIGAPTLAATNAVTTNTATTLRVTAPVAGTNVTLGGAYALQAIGNFNASGRTALGTQASNIPAAVLQLLGDQSLTATNWGVGEGAMLKVQPNTLTATTGSGTIATRVANSFGIPTFASTNANTVTNAATVYIEGAPTAGTNTTITNAYSLYVAGGYSYLGNSAGLTGNSLSGSTWGTPGAAETGFRVVGGSDYVGLTTYDRDGNAGTTNDKNGVVYWGDNTDDDLMFVHQSVDSGGPGTYPLNERMRITAAGNVGIGTAAPSTKLMVVGGTNVTNASGTGFVQLGVDNAPNLAIDQNELQARDNGSVSTLYLQKTGGNIGVGTTTPSASAILDLTSTTQGFLPPRMTTTELGNIASPANGLLVYDSTVGRYKAYQGGSWSEILTSAPGNGVAWSALSNPTANLALSMAGYTTNFTYGNATGASTNMFNITDTASNTGTGYLLNVDTATGSAASPLRVGYKGTDALWVSGTTGNVIVGTKLYVSQNADGAEAQAMMLHNHSNTNGTASAIAFSTTTNVSAVTGKVTGFRASGTDFPISFSTYDGSTVAERMRINTAGNLVIGTGEGAATVTGGTVRTPDPAGTDKTGGNLTLRGGLGTGTGATGDVIFQSAPAGSTGTTAQTAATGMIFKGGSGYVGLGTVTPAAPLHLYASAGAQTKIWPNGIDVASNNASTPIVNIAGGSGADLLRLIGASSAPVLYATSAGLVGIGNASPAYKLDVLSTSTVTSGTYLSTLNYTNVTPSGTSSGVYTGGTNDIRITSGVSTDLTGSITASNAYARHAGTGVLDSGYGATNLFTATSTGNTAYGYGASNEARSGGANTITYGYGAQNRAIVNAVGAAMNTGTGAYNVAQISNGTMTNATGSRNTVYSSTTTAITNAKAVLAEINNASTAAITNAYGMQSVLDNTGGGAITNWYGLHIPAVTGTAPTNKYPVYVADTGTNYFAGNVGIGTSAPQFKTHIYGLNAGAEFTGLHIQNGDNAASTSAALSFGAAITNNLSTGKISNVRISNNDMALAFSTYNGSLNERMRLTSAGALGIGTTTPNASAILDLTSTTKGFLPPRMTAAERTAISSPANGLLVYDTDAGRYKAYQGGAWNDILTSAPGNGISWSSLADPTANMALAMGGYTSTFTYGATTGASTNLFNLTDTASNTGTGYLMNLTTATGSALKPFRVAAAGVEAIAVDANGRVGIGTTSPTTPLSVSTAQGTSGGILVVDSTDSNNPRIQLRTSNPNGNGVIEVLDNTETVKIQLHGNGSSYINSGNLGIGTTNPSYLLSLGGEAARTIGMERTSAGTTGYQLTVQAGGAKSATADLAGGNLTLSSGIATGTGSSNIYFRTATAGTTGTTDNTPSQKMAILGNGNVGIGILNPSTLLQVGGTAARYTALTDIGRVTIVANDNIAATPALTLRNTYDGGYGLGIRFELGYGGTASTEGTASAGAAINAIQEQTWTSTAATRDSALVFGVALNGTVIEGMRIASSGNVGIGTTTPAAKIDALSTTEQLRLSYDASNYLSVTVDSTGTPTFMPSGNGIIMGRELIATTGFRTSTTATSSNLYIPSSTSIYGSLPTATLQLKGSTNSQHRIIERGSGNTTLDPSTAYASHIIGQQAVTEAATGTHPILSQFAVRPLTVTAGAGAVTDAATVYIEDAGNAVVAGGNYSLWVDAGEARFDDYINLQKNFAGAPTSGDCDASGEVGRMTYDTTNNRWYVCTSTSGWVYASMGASGGTSVAGSDKQIQFNDGGTTLAGAATLGWDKTNSRLGVGTLTPLAALDVRASDTSAIPTNIAGFDGHAQIYNTSDSANYSALRLITRTTNSTQAMLGLGYGTGLGDGYMFFRIRDGSTTNKEVMRLAASGNVGIGVSAAPSYSLSLGGDTNRTISMERASTATNGYRLTVQAGGGQSGTADLNGGDLVLTSGVSTGTGSSNIYLATSTPQGSTSTTDNSQTTKMTIAGNGNVGIGNKSPPIYTLTLGREATRTIGIERSSPNNSGASLIITAGGSVPAVADKGGGNLYLDSGAATGLGSSNIYLRTATPQSSTSTADNTPDAKMTILGNGNVGIGTTTPAARLSLAGNKSAAAWTNTGISLSIAQATYTDTSSSGALNTIINYFGQPTFASTNATTPNITNVRIDPPVFGTNASAGSLTALAVVGSSSSYGIVTAMGKNSFSYNNTPSAAGLVTLGGTGNSSAMGANGVMLAVLANTMTDTSSSAGTVPTRVSNSFGIPTMDSTNATTVTNAANVYIADAPAATGNTTITNPYALYVAAGNSYFGGYTQLAKNFAGAPTSTDCDAAAEVGRTTYDTTNNRWYVCTSTSGWVYANMGTSGGTTAAAGSDKQIQFNDGGTTLAGAATLGWDKTNSRLGVGTLSPIVPLHVSTGSSGQATPGNNADEMVIESAGNTGMSIFSGTTSTGQINFGDSGGSAQGRIVYDNNDDSMSLYTNASQAIKITTAGRVGFNTGSNTPSYQISIDGENNRTIGQERTTTGTNGNSLTLLAGGAKAGTADLNGGNLYLSSGTATGTGSSNIYFQTAAAGATGTADRAPATAMTILGNNNVGIGTTTPGAPFEVRNTSTITSGTAYNTLKVLTANPSATSTGTYYGDYSQVSSFGTNDLTTMRAYRGLVQHNTASAIGNIRAIDTDANNSSTGTITDAFGGVFAATQADTTGSISRAYGLSASAVSNRSAGTGISTVYGGKFRAQNAAAGATTTNYGVYSDVYNSGAGTMTNATPVYAEIANAASSTITNAYGLRSELNNSGTVTNWYGLYIGALTGNAPGTLRRPIYVADTGDSVLAGGLGVGSTSAPRSKLDVQGDAGAYGPIYWSGGSSGSILGEYGAAITNVAATSARHGVGLQIDSIDASGSGYTGIGQIISRVTSTGGGSPTGLVVTDISNTATARTGWVNGIHVTNITGNSGTNSGTPSYAAGLHVGTVTFAGADVTGYSNGLLIDNAITNSTTAANVYAINSLSTAKSYFAGNIGIGTSSPTDLLNVGSGGYARFEKAFAGAPTGTDCDAAGEVGRMTYDTTNNRWYVCTSTSGWVYASMGTSGGTVAAAGSDKQIQFNDGGTTLAGAATLGWDKTNGRLGVGTLSPSTKLHVGGAIRAERTAVSTQFVDIYGGTSENIISSNAPEGSKKPLVFESVHGSQGSAAGALGFVFKTGAASGSSEVARITEAGRLGIGTSSPAAKLQVVGGDIVIDSGQYLFASGTGTLRLGDDDHISFSAGKMYLDYATGNFGIGTTTPSSILAFGGEAARTIGMERPTTATNGLGLTINAGGSKASTADLNGGNLTLASGVATGTGSSDIVFQTSTAAATGSTDNAVSTKMTIKGSGNVGIGTTSPAGQLDVTATNTSTANTTVYNTYNQMTVSPGATSDTNFNGVRNYVVTSGSSDITGLITGMYGYGRHNSSGLLTTGYGSNNLFAATGTGNTTTGYGAYNETISSAANTITTAYGALNRARTNHASGVITTGVGAYNESRVSLGTITTAYGSRNVVVNATTTPMTLAYGLTAEINNNSTAAITNAYSMYASLDNSGGGAITNWYGLYIPANAGTAPTNRYPLYIANTGASYFTGNITMNPSDGSGSVGSPDLTLGVLKFNNRFDNAGNTTANKIIMYDNGSSRYGVGVSAGTFDLFGGTAGFNFYTNHQNETTPGTMAFSIDGSSYMRSTKSFAGAPTSTDCDAAGEVGRMTYDTTNNRWYVCTSASGWVYTAMGTSGGPASAAGSDKQIQFNDGGSTLAGAATLGWDKTNSRLGIGTLSPSTTIGLGGEAASAIGMERTVAGTTGYGLTVSAGGAKASTADLAGGNLTLTSGTATGTGSSDIVFQTATAQGSTASTDNAPTTKMIIKGGGNVGIGTTTPNYPLHVVGGGQFVASGTDTALRVTTSSSADETIQMYRSANTSPLQISFQPAGSITGSNKQFFAGMPANANRFVISAGTGGSGTSYFNVTNAGAIGLGQNTTSPSYSVSLNGEAAVTVGQERTTAGATPGYSLTLLAGGARTGGTDLNGGDLTLSSGTSTGTGSSNIYFKTATPGTTGSTDRAPSTSMTILGSGNVGIGTTTPSSALSFGGSSTRHIAMERAGSSTGNSLYITAGGAASGGTDLAGGNLYMRSGVSTGTGSSNLYFQTQGAGSTGTADNSYATRMVIGGNGYVGIGTTSPTGLIHAVVSSGRQFWMDPLQANVLIQSNDNNTISTALTLRNTYDGLYGVGFTMSLGYGGTGGLAGTAAQGSRISTTPEQTYTSTASTQDATMRFDVAQDGTLNERMRITSAGTLAVGTSSPDATALLDLTSTTRGLLPPRMTTAQRTAISSPATGLVVYDTDLGSLYIKNSGSWAAVGGSSVAGSDKQIQFNDGGSTMAGAANLYWDKTNNRLGLGTSTPSNLLHVSSTAARYMAFDENFGSLLISANDNQLLATALKLRNTFNGGYGTAILFQLGYGGNGGSQAGTTVDGARIGVLQEQTWTSTASTQDAAMRFDTAQDGVVTESMRLTSNGRLGIGTGNPSYTLSLGGGSVRTIGMERVTTGAGNSLYLRAGGAESGANNQNGGDLYLRSGTSTGTGTSSIYFQTMPAGASGATDNSHATAMTILGDGKVGIGTTSPSYELDVNTGTVRATAYLYTSDERKKNNIETVDGLDLVSKLRGVSFVWKDSREKAVGVIAQEVERVFPTAVKTDKDGFKSVDYPQLIGPMIEAIKDLKAMVEDIAAKIAKLFDIVGELKAENEALRGEVDTLKDQNADILKRLEALEAR